jgi:hypothetical protein
MPRPSVTSSLRSSMDHATGAPKARLPGDKITLSEWSPPPCSMMASSLMEVDQLRALVDYVKNIEKELGWHNELRAPLIIAVSHPLHISFWGNKLLIKTNSSHQDTPTPQKQWPTGNANPNTCYEKSSSLEHTSTRSPPRKCKSRKSTRSARRSRSRKTMRPPRAKGPTMMVRKTRNLLPHPLPRQHSFSILRLLGTEFFSL